MKKIVLFFCICASISTLAQDKKVAMLETIGVTPDVSSMVKNMVRGELSKSISLEAGFSAFTRLDVDQMMTEMDFQLSGMVSDDQRAKLGEMSGADFVCISKVSKDGESYYIEASLINITTGQIENPATDFVESGGMVAVNRSCQKIAKELVSSNIAILETSKTKEVQRKDIEYISIFQTSRGNPVRATLGEKKISGTSKIRKILTKCPDSVLIFNEALSIWNKEDRNKKLREASKTYNDCMRSQ